jgi:hypothetical protein
MIISKEELFAEAINLSPMDKAKLLEYMLSSFNFKDRKDIDSAWSIETEDRVRAIKNGEMKTISIEDVFSSLD